jgi:hypothetical protein
MDSEKAHTSIVRDESLDTQMGHLANAEDHDTNKFGAIRK